MKFLNMYSKKFMRARSEEMKCEGNYTLCHNCFGLVEHLMPEESCGMH